MHTATGKRGGKPLSHDELASRMKALGITELPPPPSAVDEQHPDLVKNEDQKKKRGLRGMLSRKKKDKDKDKSGMASPMSSSPLFERRNQGTSSPVRSVTLAPPSEKVVETEPTESPAQLSTGDTPAMQPTTYSAGAEQQPDQGSDTGEVDTVLSGAPPPEPSGSTDINEPAEPDDTALIGEDAHGVEAVDLTEVEARIYKSDLHHKGSRKIA